MNFLSSQVWIGHKKDLHFPNLGGVVVEVDICIFLWCYKPLKDFWNPREGCFKSLKLSETNILAYSFDFSRDKIVFFNRSIEYSWRTQPS
jgi:hypothetical protein